MTGAMYSAISGLRAHMQKLNVIGNNIANVNTNGYKSQRVVFHDSLYITSQSGSNGTTTIGARNPGQIGYGSVVGTIDLDMSTGTYAPGKSSDCMINGEGFFVTGDKTLVNTLASSPNDPNALKAVTLSRLGDVDFRADGFLTDGGGNVIYGFLTMGYDKDGYPLVSDQLVPIRLPRMYEKTIEYTLDEYKVETKNDALTQDDIDKLNTEDRLYHQSGSAIYPKYFKMEDVPEYPATGNDEEKKAWETQNTELTAMKGRLVDGLSTGNIVTGTVDNDYPIIAVDSITIDQATGKISAVTKETNDQITIGYIAIANVTNPNGVTHTGGPYYKAMDGAGDLSIGLMGGAAQQLGIYYVNGSLSADNSKVGGDGADKNDYKYKTNDITGNALPNGVYKAGTEAAGSNPATDPVEISKGMRCGNAGTTELITGGLELSKTDLATEISELITTQRGYQANTRIITVTDSMLEELVNLKR